MNLEDLQFICNKLDNVTEDIKWGQDLCFNIGGKMFLVANAEGNPVSASFKTPVSNGVCENDDKVKKRNKAVKSLSFNINFLLHILDDTAIINLRKTLID